jgi:hypothetical protein
MARQPGRHDEDDATREAIDAAFIRSPEEPVDPEIEEEFHATEAMARSGSERLAKKLGEHHSQSPELTAGDVDAAWDRSDVGEESPGGSVATPDQAVVEEIGEAIGLTFEDDEPVDAPTKVGRRDRKRWELNPVSAEDFEERQRD